ncbi:DUF397 domain-containing protein [Streptomyces sp. NPDC006290]|uniref:DUF397 domain-containing protein n=1 Tax=Streptomyces sp. NPDC006290 TaxID=3156745 RepID=UPI0033BA190F
MSITEPTNHDRPAWFTSSYSNGAGGECVECALVENGAVVRDSKDSEGPVMAVRSSAWRSFVAGLTHMDPTR